MLHAAAVNNPVKRTAPEEPSAPIGPAPVKKRTADILKQYSNILEFFLRCERVIKLQLKI